MPNTVDFTTWGNIVYQLANFYIKDAVLNSEYYLMMYDYHIEVELRIKKRILFKFKDVLEKKEKSINSFTRYVKNQKYIYLNGELVLKKEPKKVKFIQPIKKIKIYYR